MASIRYAPVGPVLTLRLSPLSLLTALTEAPAIAAPVLSVTVPAIMPRLVCAKETSGVNRNAARRMTETFPRRLRILNSSKRSILGSLEPVGRMRCCDASAERELAVLHLHYGCPRANCIRRPHRAPAECARAGERIQQVSLTVASGRDSLKNRAIK